MTLSLHLLYLDDVVDERHAEIPVQLYRLVL